MYQVGQLIVCGSEGVCRVEQVGPVEVKGAQKGAIYYTLSSVYRAGRVYIPVEAGANCRPVLTREEAQALLDDIPNIPAEVFECSNPRLLTDHYQGFLKGGSCRDLLRVLRAIHEKGLRAAQKGRRLGQVDERIRKQAEEKLCGELAVSLEVTPEEIRRMVAEKLG